MSTLIAGGKCLGMQEAVYDVFPDVKYRRCIAHFCRNVCSVVPRSKVKLAAKMLKAIHAQQGKKAEDGVEETLTYADFPSEHWARIRANRVVGAFPDGNSDLMLVCARLRHVAGSQWSNKKYLR